MRSEMNPISRKSIFDTSSAKKSRSSEKAAPIRNTSERKTELDEMAKLNSKIDISAKVKDFAKIKSAVDKAPDLDRSEKIAQLKEQIAKGQYKIDYDAVADKMLKSEF